MESAQPPGAAHRRPPEAVAGETEARYDIDRVLALVDETIGLRSEMAEQRYRNDLALWAVMEEAEARRVEMEARVAAAEQRVDDLLASRSWRIGQLVLRPVDVLRRLRRGAR